MRPEYEEDNTIHSIATWEEACAKSLLWADGARQAAVKRKRWRRFLGLMMVIVMIAIALLLFLFLTDNLIDKV